VVEVGGDVLEPAHVGVELSAEAAHLLDERQAVVGGRGGGGTDLSGGAERRGGADGAGRGFSRRPQELEGPPAVAAAQGAAEAAHLRDERQAVVGGRGGGGTDLSGGAERRGGADGAGRGFSRRPQELEGPPAVPAAQGAAEPARALVEGPGLGRPLA